jgi:hypothetical protein
MAVRSIRSNETETIDAPHSWREHTLLSVTDGCLLEAGDGKSLRFRSGNSER